MPKVGLVTGAAGFIGSHLCDRLLSDGWTVVGVDDFSAGRHQNIEHLLTNSRFKFVNIDVTKADDLDNLSLIGVDCVFHHAGKKMAFSVKQPREDLLTNALGTLNMLIWSKKNNAKRFTMASTIGIHGNSNQLPWNESMRPTPNNPYGVSKATCEEYCRLWHNEYGVPVVIFRYGSIYGPRQGINVGAVNAFISKIIKNEPVIVYGDGSNTRPFTYIADVVEANILAANSTDESIIGQTFNVTSGLSVTLKELIDMISNKLQKKPTIIFEKERVGELKHMEADISLIRNKMGFKPTTSIEEGVSKTVENYEKEQLQTLRQ